MPHPDYTDTQLRDADIIQLEERLSKEDAIEAEKERLRIKKMRSFRFQGGML